MGTSAWEVDGGYYKISEANKRTIKPIWTEEIIQCLYVNTTNVEGRSTRNQIFTHTDVKEDQGITSRYVDSVQWKLIGIVRAMWVKWYTGLHRGTTLYTLDMLHIKCAAIYCH